MVTMPVITRLAISGYGLFPGDPSGSGIDKEIRPGLTLIAGINGLGKTTLLNAVLRALTGPNDLTGEGAPGVMGVSMPHRAVALKPKPLSFFRQRVADEASTATVSLNVEFGSRTLSVTRKLSDLSLTAFDIDGAPVMHGATRAEREGAYQSDLTELMGLGSFEDVLLILHHVVLFQEDRPGALWDENAQRQILRALFLDGPDSRRVAELERQVQSTDSQARNIQAQITATERELLKARRQEAGSEQVAAQLDAEQRLLDADLVEKARLDEVLSNLDDTRHRVRLEHERAKIAREEAGGAVERIKYSALANIYPNMKEAYRLALARVLNDGKCLVCDAVAEVKRAELEEQLENGICPVCFSPPEEQHNVVGTWTFEQAKLDAAKEAFLVARNEEEAKRAEVAGLAANYSRVLDRTDGLRVTIAERTDRNRRLRAALPTGVSSREIDNALVTLRRRLLDWTTQRAAHVRDLGTLLSAKEGLIRAQAEAVIRNFALLTERLLAEPARLAEVRFRPRYTQAAGASGDERLQFPAYKAEMVAANRPGFVRRFDPSDVSESQRELIDLAFRLSLVRVAAPNSSATFIMETPEASLDGISMDRVGRALADFSGSSNNRLIVTSNLSNAGLITSLFGGPTESADEVNARQERLINLLQVAAPNRALENNRAEYERLLNEALTGSGG
jgi:hypothetical protein